MKIKNIEKRDLTYEIICNAIKGDMEAEEAIFDYFEPYIIKLSKKPLINERGQVQYIIDEDIYMSLKLRLHELVGEFAVS